MNNHTQSEWFKTVNIFGEPLVATRINGNSEVIAHFSITGELEEKEQQANASLCKAAPKMMAALVEALHEIQRLNSLRGETVFNPAATDLVKAAISDGGVDADEVIKAAKRQRIKQSARMAMAQGIKDSK